MRKVLHRTDSRTRRLIGYRIGPEIASVLLFLPDFAPEDT
jgi:hypothetical protein